MEEVVTEEELAVVQIEYNVLSAAEVKRKLKFLQILHFAKKSQKTEYCLSKEE